MSLILSRESAVMDSTVKEASLPIAASGSRDHDLYMVSDSHTDVGALTATRGHTGVCDPALTELLPESCAF